MKTIITSVIFSLGLILAILIPPLNPPDEMAHWHMAVRNTYKIFGYDDPKCNVAHAIIEQTNLGQLRFHFENKVDPASVSAFYDFSGSSCYGGNITYGSVFTYTPTLFAASIIAHEPKTGRDALKLFYLSRILGGLIYALLVAWLLVKIWPVSITAFLFLGLLAVSPLMLQQMFSVSSDWIVNTFAIILGGFFIDVFRSQRPIPRPYFWILSLLIVTFGFVASTTKPVIFPLIGIMLLIFGHKYRKNIFDQTALCTLIIFGTLFVFQIFFALKGSTAGDSFPNEASPTDQISYLLSNPMSGFYNIYHAIIYRFFGIQDFFFHPLGHHDTPISASVVRGFLWGFKVLLYSGAILFLVKAFRSSATNNIYVALMVIGLYFSLMLPVLAMYLCHTPVGAIGVSGVQSRYFFPMLFLAGSMYAALVPSYRTYVLKKWKFSHTVVKYAGIFLGVFAFLTLAIYLILDIKKRYG